MHELNQKEMDEITGGNPLVGPILVALLAATYNYLLNHWSEFKDGVTDGVKSTIAIAA